MNGSEWIFVACVIYGFYSLGKTVDEKLKRLEDTIERMHERIQALESPGGNFDVDDIRYEPTE
jgi:predicted RNase H-like HicB family nuclease